MFPSAPSKNILGKAGFGRKEIVHASPPPDKLASLPCTKTSTARGREV